MAGRADSGRPIDVQTEIGAAFDDGLAGVETYAWANSDSRRPRERAETPLNRDSCRQPCPWRLEGGEELIGTTIDLISTRVSDGLSKQTPLRVEGGRVILAEPLDKLGKAVRALRCDVHSKARCDRLLPRVPAGSAARAAPRTPEEGADQRLHVSDA